MNSRALKVLALAAVLMLGMAGYLYAFGTPTAPAPNSGTPVSANEMPASPMGGDPAAAQVAPAPTASGEVPEADPKSPLAIQIPGCVCHSDDKKLVDEHASYRMNQCAGCHAGNTPTGQ